MTIQTYKAIQGGYVPSDDGPVVFKTDYLREIEHYQSDDRGKTNEINILTKENRALTARIKELTEALESIRATARAVMEAKDHDLNIDPEWVIAKVGAALGGDTCPTDG
jgi:predicted RNase H-like nuclease (RuvC/YqgF family)